MEKFTPVKVKCGPPPNPVTVSVPLVITSGSAVAVAGVNATIISRVANTQRIFDIQNFLSGCWEGKPLTSRLFYKWVNAAYIPRERYAVKNYAHRYRALNCFVDERKL